MEWYRRVQFIAAVPMPEDVAEEYGTTVNGMWAAPEQRSAMMVRDAHARDCRVLFSVPLIALTPRVYQEDEHHHLLDEVCRDIEGNRSLVPWYYWESDPVYSMCIYSPVFRHYLLDRCREGIDRGMDVVNLDEINSSIGLMNRGAGGSGFCKYCLERFRRHLSEEAPELAEAADGMLRQRIRDDDVLFQQYRRFHELEAFDVIVSFITELRTHAEERNPQFAITANVAYLGNLVEAMGDLWGPMWGEHIDFVMMENIYQPERQGPHLLLPRGKFTAWYRLGSSFSSHSPTWICPSIMVPRQMAGERRIQYYLLMFLEAYANGGRWGYYWWPGVDAETRLRATAPEQLKDYIRFITQYRDYYEQASTDNHLALLYLNSGMRKRPESHVKYLALAQALAEDGYQYDVIYGGDGIYSPDDLDMERLRRYQAILVPEAADLTDAQEEGLARFASGGGEVIRYARGQADPIAKPRTEQDEELLFSYWRDYREADRGRITASVSHLASARVRTSNPLVNVIRTVRGGEQILHLINYNYEPETDSVTPAERLTVRVPWDRPEAPEVRWLSLGGEQQRPCRLEEGELVFEITRLESYGLAVLCS